MDKIKLEVKTLMKGLYEYNQISTHKLFNIIDVGQLRRPIIIQANRDVA